MNDIALLALLDIPVEWIPHDLRPGLVELTLDMDGMVCVNVWLINLKKI